MPHRFLVCAFALIALSSCAANYYDVYKKEHPDWFPVFPDSNLALDETVASIYAPPVSDYMRVVAQIEILRLRGVEWETIPVSALLSGEFVPSGSETYAVIANVHCRSEVDLKRYYGDGVSWYLLPNNQLSASDHYDYSDRCVVFNTYDPATEAEIEWERRLIEIVERDFSSTRAHSADSYRKGLKLAEIGRLDDAVDMLRLGDETLDPDSRGPVRFDPGRAAFNLTDDADTQRVRDALLQVLFEKNALERRPPEASAP